MFFFLLRPRADAHSLTALRAWVVPPPRRGGVFFFAAAPPGPGWCFFLAVAPPRRSLTHCGLGRFRQGSGGVFFLLWPRPVFLGNSKKCLVYYIGSKKTRRGHNKKKKQKQKTPRGGVFFLLRPRADAHSLTAGLGGASPSPGWCFFFCCGPARTGVVFFFFLLWPRPDAHSLTVGWGDFGKVRVVFFFCCGPAGSFLVSLKRPGGAAAKKNTTGRCFFFLLRPRADAHSLTAGLGGASPSPGWCFFFCCGPARTGVVFFFWLWPRPDAHSLTVGWGDFGKVRVVFFLLWPRPVFLGNSKKCLVYYIGSKKTRQGHNKKKNTTSLLQLLLNL